MVAQTISAFSLRYKNEIHENLDSTQLGEKESSTNEVEV